MKVAAARPAGRGPFGFHGAGARSFEHGIAGGRLQAAQADRICVLQFVETRRPSAARITWEKQ